MANMDRAKINPTVLKAFDRIREILRNQRRSRVSRLTVMIFGTAGRVFSFEISSVIFTGALMFLLLYIVASVIVINDYFDKRHLAHTQEKKLESLHQDMKETQKNLYQSRQRVILLRDFIAKRESSGGEKPEEEETGREKRSVGAQAEVISLSNFELRRDGANLRISFRIYNEQNEENPASGYIHIIAMDHMSNPSRSWTFPDIRLKDGLPVDYRKGQRFYIHRFKVVRARIPLNAGGESARCIKVLVYDRAGTLLKERMFEVAGIG